MFVVVVSVQVMVIDVAVCMVALRLLGGLGTASENIFSIVCTDGPIICSKEYSGNGDLYTKSK